MPSSACEEEVAEAGLSGGHVVVTSIVKVVLLPRLDPRRYRPQVTVRAFRIRVRGVFEDLTADQRTDLLNRASEHDPLTTSFTPEGHLSFDLAARPNFTFRFSDTGERDEDLGPATERAEAAARAWLDERGLAFRLLESKSEDMSQAPMSKRQRRSQQDR